mmetsp:Transcript_23687/g.29160  ORF Transcript_23687/g.29160 Transcript_23687/m.29160 type:complete len:370 (-) Transcript_23687:121-1230(-)|eukprot:CAMPEP_0204831544 /NCGR_PEP_ID=MMETSP1346-20131115/10842_1 /ASSEMBLY_ACC=CAM_ASM_000771 /TAXON_ID=215587 /ORGANISM="Aplanochytrium stocchinoi, Strain GSBS06" /LENGTH=369 /DNA_ID=CAMNT_0051962641 /DNA_START=290 /DNA_END=1399 /DNA_ORIENTATION=-
MASFTLPDFSKPLKEIVPPGVLIGDDVMKVLAYAKHKGFAIPAVNCTSSSTVNAVLEAARKAQSPVMIQFSNGGAAFVAGKGISNKNQEGSILGAVAGAYHARAMAKHYGVPVILHSDHCAKNLLPWLDGMLDADEKHFKENGEPLFSSHMIDLSEETLEENIAITSKYLERCKSVNVILEMELGITGGEEDGVDNTGVDNEDLYSKPEEVWEVYKALSAITDKFTVAAAFGNVHGVYKPGNVVLQPQKLEQHQAYIKEKLGCEEDKPVYFVFHGGSGSTHDEIQTAVKAGVIKMNIDTDTQWAYWNGIRKFEAEFHDYLQSQIGNPEGADKPNKNKYDPRVWIRKAEESMSERLQAAFKSLNALNTYA